MNTSYHLYWYRLENHNNIYTDGYVGITNDLERRHKEHMDNVRLGVKSHFYNAVRKHKQENLIREVMYTGSIDDVSNMEYALRPDKNIGWNAAVGGLDGVSEWYKKPVTMFHKDNPEVDHHFTSHTEAAKVLGLEVARITQAVRRGNVIYGFDGWAVLCSPDTDKTKVITVQEQLSRLQKGKPKHYANPFKGMTDRWSKEERERIGRQHKGKKLSSSHIQALKTKNRHSSTCVPVTLAHESDKSIEYTYHSISEASRELDIPLSRLKGKAQRALGVYGKDGWAILRRGSE